MEVNPKGQSQFFQIQVLYFLRYLRLLLTASPVLLAVAFLVPRLVVAAVAAAVDGLVLHIVVAAVVAIGKALRADARTDALHAIIAPKSSVILTLIHYPRADGTDGRPCDLVAPIEQSLLHPMLVVLQPLHEHPSTLRDLPGDGQYEYVDAGDDFLVLLLACGLDEPSEYTHK